MVASDGDASAVRVLFWGAHFTDHFGIWDFMMSFGWDIAVKDGAEGAVPGMHSNALAEAAKFVGI